MSSKKHRKKQVEQEKKPVVDYDDSDPWSCLAAAAKEMGLPLRNTEERVESCYHQGNSRLLKDLIKDDRDGVIRGLWRIWGRAHGKYYRNADLARWAARQLEALGDSTLMERERGYSRGLGTDR